MGFSNCFHPRPTEASHPAGRLCRNRKEAISIVMPVKIGIQNIIKILD
jgi:hypothetical protein